LDKKLNIINTNFLGLHIVEPNRMKDERGYFQRLFCSNEFAKINLDKPIVNINHSMTQKKGTIRGMHFQYQPYAEIKIVKCIKGAIFDVAIDIRQGSPTFMQSYSIELSDKNNLMLVIPEGFAHGFQSLEENSEIIYFVTNHYSKENESGLNPFDPRLNINWPLECNFISQKDKNSKLLPNDFQGIVSC